ncbi:MAG TPA: hypothetical protein VMU47_11050 [Caldimonas sp.]|nr:hypothetical protein [Caldimonas sp.]
MSAGELSESEKRHLERPQTDRDRLSWLDAQRGYMQSEGPMRAKGQWYIHFDVEQGAWISGRVEVNGGHYEEESHATLREAVDRLAAI